MIAIGASQLICGPRSDCSRRSGPAFPIEKAPPPRPPAAPPPVPRPPLKLPSAKFAGALFVDVPDLVFTVGCLPLVPAGGVPP